MSVPVGPFEFRILVSADTPEEESQIVNNIASEFIRMGIHTVCVIANEKHVNYVNGEAFDVTMSMSGLFQATPEETTGAFVVSHTPSTTLN